MERTPGFYWVWDDSYVTDTCPARWRVIEWCGPWIAKNYYPNGKDRIVPAGWMYDLEEESWVKEENVGDMIPTPEDKV